jgi:ParB family transcriptional regulator, chromosome partitioning protein
LHDEKIFAGHARVLLSCAEPEALAEKIVARNLSVRDAEKLLEGAPESSGANGE